jgi:hypothetical protein
LKEDPSYALAQAGLGQSYLLGNDCPATVSPVTETMMTFEFPPEGAQSIESGFRLPVEKGAFLDRMDRESKLKLFGELL